MKPSLIIIYNLLFVFPLSLTISGDEVPGIVGEVLEKRRMETIKEVERDFKGISEDSERFKKLILAINRGVFAKGKITAPEIEKMLASKMEADLDNRTKKMDVRWITWIVEFDDFTSYTDRDEKITKTTTWKSYFEFDESGRLVRFWLE